MKRREPSCLELERIDCFATQRGLDDDSMQRSIFVIVKKIEGSIEGELTSARE